MPSLLFYGLSTLAVCLLGLGVWFRRQRERHVPLMVAALGVDLVTLVGVELQRHAVEKVVAGDLPALTIFHVTVSTLALLLYGVTFYWGIRLLRGDETVRGMHRLCAGVFLLCRLTNYVTSYMVGGS